MPFVPEEDSTASSKKMSGNISPASSRKRARTDSENKGPKAKIVKTEQEDERLADLKASLTDATIVLDAAMTEIRATKADIKLRKRNMKDLAIEFHDIIAMIAERSIIYTAGIREERLEKENASLRDRIKRLEEASSDDIMRETDQESRPRRRPKSHGSKALVDEPDVGDKSAEQGV
ncbi:hypothetical protein F4781DRAFT_143219 [Annulohypoxylon bovei var. microspora]|nr:hypothetical protein F4781DRAFT_143219 [Annulohypoxylon bovei var. microspora]